MHRRAFTLIELLVVISIIALLASVVLASLNSAREKGRLGSARYFAAQVDHVSGEQAVGIWDFSECSGITAGDRSGFGNLVTFTSTPTWPTDTPSGTGCSVGLNGTSQYGTAPNNSNLALGTELTISVWLKITGYSGVTNPRIVQKYDDANNEYSLSIGGVNGPGRISFHFKKSGTAYDTFTTAVLPIGKWVHVAGVFNGSSVAVYFDGVLQPTTVSGFVVQETDGKFYISGTAFFGGFLDDLHVFAKSLTGKDIGKLYALESARHENLAAK